MQTVGAAEGRARRRGRRIGRVACGGGLAVAGAAVLAGCERRARLLRTIDRHVNFFGGWRGVLYAWVTSQLLGGFYQRVAGDVVTVLAEGAVLDVGTGPGALPLELAREHPALRITAIDCSSDMIGLARWNGVSLGLARRVQFMVGDVAALPYRDQSFDLVVSTLSLHYWPRVVAALRECHRVLRPGGCLWVYDVRGIGPLDGEFEVAAAQTPFAGQPVERLPIRVGPLPVPLFVRLALRRV